MLLVGLIIVAVVAFFLYPLVLILIFFLFIFCLFFFRNPIRVCQEAFEDPSVIVCPADGTVIEIAHCGISGCDEYMTKISIFLSPLDAHVNWLPIGGKVVDIAYHKGKFIPAFLPKASELNERNDVLLQTDNGTVIKVRQITGTIARTIVCWVSKGQTVQAGETFGMMKFGSRIDLFLPSNAQIILVKGQRVYGGQTVVGRFI